jgi:hypothetical protein
MLDVLLMFRAGAPTSLVRRGLTCGGNPDPAGPEPYDPFIPCDPKEPFIEGRSNVCSNDSCLRPGTTLPLVNCVCSRSAGYDPIVIARSSGLSGICRPCDVVLGPCIAEYGCCLKAPAVPCWYALGGGLYIGASPGRIIDRDLNWSEFSAAEGSLFERGLF